MQGAVFRLPEKFILAPLWDNPMIQRNKTPLKEASMPMDKISKKKKTMPLGYRKKLRP